uniref:Potassium channel domain-containing protein n=1 Tax=Zooxanthella nutricula TaxID=1333877 RepID=A0A7S2Q498_9DINO
MWLLRAAAAVCVWVVGGAIIYYRAGNCSVVLRMDSTGRTEEFDQCPWTFGQSFYFAVQTGLSIGFGLLSETSRISKCYSMINILVGSSIISGALALFVQVALSKSASFQSREEQRLAEASAKIHADGYSGFRADELVHLMVQYPQYAKALIWKLEPKRGLAKQRVQAFTEAGHRERTRFAAEIIRECSVRLPEFDKGNLNISDLECFEQQADGCLRKLGRCMREHRTFLVAYTCLLAYWGIGVLFSLVADKNDWITSMYFALSTLSTAGMVAVKTVESNAHVVFVGCYALLGVPMYCFCLGMLANVFVDRYSRHQVHAAMHSKLSKAEMEFLAHASRGDDQSEDIDFAEFMEFQLLRLGRVDRTLLADLREQFQRLDNNHSGRICRRELLSQHMDDTSMFPRETTQATGSGGACGAESGGADDGFWAKRVWWGIRG